MDTLRSKAHYDLDTHQVKRHHMMIEHGNRMDMNHSLTLITWPFYRSTRSYVCMYMVDVVCVCVCVQRTYTESVTSHLAATGHVTWVCLPAVRVSLLDEVCCC